MATISVNVKTDKDALIINMFRIIFWFLRNAKITDITTCWYFIYLHGLKSNLMNTVFSIYEQQPEQLEGRVKQIIATQIEGSGGREVMKKILGMLDLTSLEGSDTKEKAIELCRNARFSDRHSDLPDAAAVCLYPSLVSEARNELKGTGIRLAAVAGGFPAGQTSLRVKLDEIRYAIAEGAGEIDTVISRGKLIEGNYTEVFDELSAMREACGPACMKVILETGELPSVQLVRKASEISILAGADFIKTSTGKIATGATPAAFLVMLDTIREYLVKTGKTVGIKAAGGVRTPEQALVYTRLFSEELGDSLLRPDYFRIGASSLASEILKLV
jgi:deoxyribose-phosphate aldolase